MRRVTEQVDRNYLAQAPPRPLPPGVIVNLLNDYLGTSDIRISVNNRGCSRSIERCDELESINLDSFGIHIDIKRS